MFDAMRVFEVNAKGDTSGTAVQEFKLLKSYERGVPAIIVGSEYDQRGVLLVRGAEVGNMIYSARVNDIDRRELINANNESVTSEYAIVILRTRVDIRNVNPPVIMQTASVGNFGDSELAFIIMCNVPVAFRLAYDQRSLNIVFNGVGIDTRIAKRSDGSSNTLATTDVFVFRDMSSFHKYTDFCDEEPHGNALMVDIKDMESDALREALSSGAGYIARAWVADYEYKHKYMRNAIAALRGRPELAVDSGNIYESTLETLRRSRGVKWASYEYMFEEERTYAIVPPVDLYAVIEHSGGGYRWRCTRNPNSTRGVVLGPARVGTDAHDSISEAVRAIGDSAGIDIMNPATWGGLIRDRLA